MSATYKLSMLFLATILTSIAFGILAALPPLYPHTLEYPSVAFGALFTATLFSIPFVAVSGVIVGIPAAFALGRFSMAGYIWWGLAGAIVGALTSLAIVSILAGSPPDLKSAGIGAWLGFLPGLVAGSFWWGAVAQYEQNEVAPLER